MPQTERLTLAQAVAQMTPEKLQAWVEALPRGYEFTRNECYDCLLASYLQDVTGLDAAVTRSWVSHPSVEDIKLPLWARELACAFDGKTDRKAKVSLKSTLRILRECCPELRRQNAN